MSFTNTATTSVSACTTTAKTSVMSTTTATNSVTA
jgi:hypothetical protein